MTGGIGFSRQGSDSFKQNRALRNKRKSMNENPYSSNKSINRGDFNLKELQGFQAKQRRKTKIISRTVILMIFLFFTLVIIYILK